MRSTSMYSIAIIASLLFASCLAADTEDAVSTTTEAPMQNDAAVTTTMKPDEGAPAETSGSGTVSTTVPPLVHKSSTDATSEDAPTKDEATNSGTPATTGGKTETTKVAATSVTPTSKPGNGTDNGSYAIHSSIGMIALCMLPLMFNQS